MNAIALLSYLRASGVVLAANDGKLAVDAPRGLLTAELLSDLRHHKAELLALLAANQEPDALTVEPDANSLAEDFEERAAIIDHDCHVYQPEAEHTALEVVFCKNCQHFQPNERNPQAGAGGCAVGGLGVSAVNGKPIIRWPMTHRYCQLWQAVARTPEQALESVA